MMLYIISTLCMYLKIHCYQKNWKCFLYVFIPESQTLQIFMYLHNFITYSCDDCSLIYYFCSFVQEKSVMDFSGFSTWLDCCWFSHWNYFSHLQGTFDSCMNQFWWRNCNMFCKFILQGVGAIDNKLGSWLMWQLTYHSMTLACAHTPLLIL